MDSPNKSEGSPITLEFCRSVPKVELHAHLHGSMRKSTLKEYMQERNIKYDDLDFETKDMTGAFRIFGYIHAVVDHIDQIKRITREMLEDFANENTTYLEIRTTPRPLSSTSIEDYINTVISEIKKYEAENPGKLTTKLLISINRAEDLEKAKQTIEVAKEYLSTGYVIGIDYSGNPSKNTFTDFQEIFEDARRNGLKTALHCAELPDEKTLKETYDVLQFKPDRVGHFNYFNEDLFQKIHDLNIPIEMCPTSNRYTMYLKDYKDHHFIKYYKTKHPICLCTDDTAVFDTNLSEEYFRIFQAFDFTIEQAKEVIKRSYECVFDEETKKRLRELVL